MYSRCRCEFASVIAFILAASGPETVDVFGPKRLCSRVTTIKHKELPTGIFIGF